jgi:hypothetical protein
LVRVNAGELVSGLASLDLEGMLFGVLEFQFAGGQFLDQAAELVRRDSDRPRLDDLRRAVPLADLQVRGPDFQAVAVGLDKHAQDGHGPLFVHYSQHCEIASNKVSDLP